MISAKDYQWQLFEKSVQRIFDDWTALSLAVDFQWGGRDSQQRVEVFRQSILSLFPREKQSKYHQDDLANILSDQLSELFNLDIDDNSDYEIAELLITLHQKYLSNKDLQSDFDSLAKSQNKDKSINANEFYGDCTSLDEDEEESEEDEDGKKDIL